MQPVRYGVVLKKLCARMGHDDYAARLTICRHVQQPTRFAAVGGVELHDGLPYRRVYLGEVDWIAALVVSRGLRHRGNLLAYVAIQRSAFVAQAVCGSAVAPIILLA